MLLPQQGLPPGQQAATASSPGWPCTQAACRGVNPSRSASTCRVAQGGARGGVLSTSVLDPCRKHAAEPFHIGGQNRRQALGEAAWGGVGSCRLPREELVPQWLFLAVRAGGSCHPACLEIAQARQQSEVLHAPPRRRKPQLARRLHAGEGGAEPWWAARRPGAAAHAHALLPFQDCAPQAACPRMHPAAAAGGCASLKASCCGKYGELRAPSSTGRAFEAAGKDLPG